jgi:hypothetical protein
MADDLKKGYRNAWILVALAVVFIIGFFAFTLYFSLDAPREGWEMGGEDFVPARSDKAEGYFVPPVAPKKGGRR